MKASWGISTLPTIFMRRFPRLLFFQQFLLAGNIAAITLGQHILAQCFDVSRAK